MNHRLRLVAVSVGTLVAVWLLAGCGGYDAADDDDSSTGGSAAEPGTGGDGSGGEATGGTGGDGSGGEATGGTGGGAAAPATGGTGGGGAVECTDVTPCGGEVVGTWNVTSSCLNISGQVDLTLVGMNCVAEQVTGSLTVTGTWIANGDGTYSDGTHTTGNHHMELGPTCKELSGTVIGCDRMGIPMASLGYTQVNCVDNAATGGCTCDGSIDQTAGLGFAPDSTAREDGSYTTADNVLTIGQATYSYCVSGTTLSLTPVSAGRTGTVVGSVELAM